MKIEEAIKAAMARMIEQREGIKVEVTGWEEEFDVYRFGGCDTCGPEYEKEYSVIIYHTWEGRSGCTNFSGSFTDLIKELDTE